MTRLRTARLLCVAALCVALAGCSATRLVYENASLLLRWRTTGYLDVHGEQLRALEAGIERFLAWHRVRALPKYVALAEDAGTRVARGLSREDLVWGYDSLRAQVREAFGAGGAELAPLLDALTPEQIRHLEQRFAEDNRKYAEEHVDGSADERRNHRMQTSVKRLEEWIGPLTAPQRERVRRYSQSAPLLAQMRLHERGRLQREIVDMARTRSAAARLAARVSRWDAGREPGFVSADRAHRDELFGMLLDIDRTLTAEQRSMAVQRLRDFAGEFRTLARADAPAGTTR